MILLQSPQVADPNYVKAYSKWQRIILRFASNDRIRLRASKAASFSLLGLAVILLYLLKNSFAEISWQNFENGLTSIPDLYLGISVLLTLLSFSLLSIIERSNLQIVGIGVSWPRAFFISSTSNAVSNQLSLAGLSGVALRSRHLREHQVAVKKVLRLTALNAISFWTGFSLLLLTVLVIFGVPPTITVMASHWILEAIGFAAALLILSAIAVAIPSLRARFKMFQNQPFPSTRGFYMQFLLSALDWLISALALYVLLPSNYSMQFGPWLVVFLIGQVSSLLLNLPAGLGILDALVLTMSASTERSEALAALVVYRCIFYVCPLLISLSAIAADEVKLKSPLFYSQLVFLIRRTRYQLAHLISFTIFVAGVALLLRSTGIHDIQLGAVQQLVAQIDMVVGAGAIQLFGLFLILVSHGLFTRSSLAWIIAIAFCSFVAIGFALQPTEFGAAGWLVGLTIALLVFRDGFDKPSALVNGTFDRKSWTCAGFAVAGIFGLIYVLPLSSRDPANVLQGGSVFSFFGLSQTIFFSSISSVSYAHYFFMRPPRAELIAPPVKRYSDRRAGFEDLVRAVSSSSFTQSQLAFVGDKRILMSEKGDEFIMFAVKRNAWVAMGDPVGIAGGGALVKRFVELSESAGGTPVFYQVRMENLGIYVDNEFHLVKIGEEAIVNLRTFDLNTHPNKSLRNTYRRVKKSGVEFKILTPGQFLDREGEFRAVSDSWLKKAGASEKGFSVGFYSQEYLARYHHAVLLKNDKVVAFANVWKSGDRAEISVDLMRQSPDAPSGSMDYLFLCLIRFGQESGFRQFNLGMAPLSGLQRQVSSPFWNLIASFLFENGEQLYKFQGIRNFKEKYNPSWQPRYIAYRKKFTLLNVTAKIVALISQTPQS